MIGYRDHRTEGMDAKVYEYIDANALYERTGIQKQIFNTIPGNPAPVPTSHRVFILDKSISCKSNELQSF